jgi:hypothetical protein
MIMYSINFTCYYYYTIQIFNLLPELPLQGLSYFAGWTKTHTFSFCNFSMKTHLTTKYSLVSFFVLSPHVDIGIDSKADNICSWSHGLSSSVDRNIK